ncbi:hypothetical protein [Plasmodium yoelii yoelii]|uniref:Uncharacterized protein n=1 Tax=Plasmodium yoelii yoelii TaxID=73239 RepID=Q7R9S7_PLAYO|nr:hypothetical protein [Plasmodium yoelii yoelii]
MMPKYATKRGTAINIKSHIPFFHKVILNYAYHNIFFYLMKHFI